MPLSPMRAQFPPPDPAGLRRTPVPGDVIGYSIRSPKGSRGGAQAVIGNSSTCRARPPAHPGSLASPSTSFFIRFIRRL